MNSRRTTRQAQDSTGKACRYLIEIKDADVYIDDKKILKKITWKIKYGENWIILGKNGAGKSTLLKLISGDLRPAAGGYIFRFGKGEKFSIRDLKKRIGLVSSSLQGSYDFNLTGEEVILSGFFSSIGLYHRVTGLQKKTAERWMRYFDAEAICKKTAMSMSYGELRKILIIRAMVNEPEMLILDEPFSGLDTPVRKDFINSIERVVKTGVSVIMATHHPDDFIPSITHVLALERGGVKMKGGKQKILEELQKK